MGLKLTLPATDNFIGQEFTDAYWSIDNITFTNYEGVSYVSFDLDTYASRDAKLLSGQNVPNTGIAYGGSYRTVYEPILHKWEASFRSETVFPNGIPISEAAQKDVLYVFVKEYTGLPFEDVFEE